jgi:hypothetical protein
MTPQSLRFCETGEGTWPRWDRILQKGNWQNLVESMIEEYLYAFGWKTIHQRVEYLGSKHGLRIKTPTSVLLFIDEAENTRHAVIHNSGKVSQEYKNRTGQTDLTIGDVIPINTKYTDQLTRAVGTLGFDVFAAVAQKFFGIKKQDLEVLNL